LHGYKVILIKKAVVLLQAWTLCFCRHKADVAGRRNPSQIDWRVEWPLLQ
jgi:hypothetical protein